MFEEDQTTDVTVLPKFDMPSYESHMTAKDVKSLAVRYDIPLDLHHILTERVIDLRPVPSGLLFQGGLATTWDFPGFRPIFKDTEGNVVTMSEYLRFPLLYVASIEKGTALTDQDRRRGKLELLPRRGRTRKEELVRERAPIPR
ncbi:hypothetical protein Tco_0928988 [Tanacetum coccineum]